MILNLAERITGRIAQKPPLYSAIKVKSKTSMVRSCWDSVEMPQRLVDAIPSPCRKIAMIALSDNTVSKGTYIRSLGVDFAKALGTVGYLSSLRRLSSDGFSIQDSLSMEELSQIVAGTDDWKKALRKGGEVEFPRAEPAVIRAEILKRSSSIEDVLVFQWEVVRI